MEIKRFEDKYSSYLSDESRSVGRAEFIAFPESESDFSECLKFAEKNKIKATVRGAGTGLLGRAVPCGGLLISTERMNKIFGVEKFGDGYILNAECGATLKEIEDFLKTSFSEYIFAPNPTEKSATLGGLFACNATGLNALQSGKFSAHIAEISCLSRAAIRLNEANFFEIIKANPDGYVKNIFITSLKLKLSKRHNVFWGVVYFFRSEKDAENFISEVLSWRNGSSFGREFLAALVYFGGKVLELVSNERERSAFSALPEIPKIDYEAAVNANKKRLAGASVYIELSGDDGERIEEALLFHAEIFERFGGENWAACGESELQKFRDMCHAVHDAINVFDDEKRAEYSFGNVAEDRKIVEPGR
jgi:D-lactate dehydrogenase (cytochrome)